MEQVNAQQKAAAIPSTIWTIGIVTLLVNLSSVMVFSLSPLYVTRVFGLPLLHLGILEGLTEFLSWFTRIFSGVISDYLHKRKPLLVVAYALIAISRPLLALAPNITWIYTAKFTDRIANGVQASPREALVGDLAPKELMGSCYGLRQSLGTIGSVLGALCVMYLMRRTDNDYTMIFAIASVPSVLALVMLIFFVKDVPPKNISVASRVSKRVSLKVQLKNTARLSPAYWFVILVSGIFMMSNYSSAYRILQAEGAGIALADVAIVMLIQNLTTTFSAYPVGRLSDLLDRRIFLGIGVGMTILANICLSHLDGAFGIIAASGLWGIQLGITQSVLLAMIADKTEPELRGTAFGIYYLVSAFGLFLANAITGLFFDRFGPETAFLVSSLIAGIGMVLIPWIKPCMKPTITEVA